MQENNVLVNAHELLVQCYTVKFHSLSVCIGKRNFWTDSNNQPPWWPSGISFSTPNGKGGRDRLNGTELVAIAEAMLSANPDSFQCQEQTEREPASMHAHMYTHTHAAVQHYLVTL